MRLRGVVFICFVFLFIFLGASFSSAFVRFFITPELATFTLKPLESSSSNIAVSFNPVITPEEGEAQPYTIERRTICNQWDEWGYDCIDAPPNLCPYISLEPNGGENTEIGFLLNASYSSKRAFGELNFPGDQNDNWILSVTSPCFEGECPAGYNSYTNGNPLPQSLKGQIFKCELRANWNGGIFPVRGLANTAYAAITDTITIEAVLTGEVEQKINPVIIIPGIMGSAQKNGELIIDPILHTYDDLIATLKANGYQEGADLFPFPYEWRDSNMTTADLLDDKIDEVKTACSAAALPDVDCSKVDLVAHSMGGLVARAYIQSNTYDGDVDQLIFLGTPHRGAPKAYLQWEAGEFPPDDWLVSLIELKFKVEATQNFYSSLFSYIQNRPVSSVQELLPTFDYIKDKDTGILRTYPNNYPRNIFLEALNTNTGISKLLNSEIKITNIIGDTGLDDTINVIRVVAGLDSLWTNGKPDGFDNSGSDRGLEKGSGDGTVTVSGATINDSIPNIVSSADHAYLPSAEENKVFNILTNKISSTDIHRNIIRKMLTIQLYSPVDVIITDPSNKRVGKNFGTGGEYNEILGAFYSGYQTDDEYITIPNPLDGEYKIELQGTDNGGKYRISTSYISDELSVTKETTGITELNQITNINVKFDTSNPENISSEKEVTPETLINDINGAYNQGWIKDTKTRDALIKQVNGAIKFNKKIDTIKERQPDGSTREKKVEKFSIKVNKILIKLFEKELALLLKKDKITQEAYNLITYDIEYLINN